MIYLLSFLCILSAYLAGFLGCMSIEQKKSKQPSYFGLIISILLMLAINGAI